MLILKCIFFITGDRGDKGAPGLAGLPASLASILDTEINPEESKLYIVL